MNDPDHSDILVTIDAALGCPQCGADLVNSASSYFCSETCQGRWTAASVDSLEIDYEPAAIPSWLSAYYSVTTFNDRTQTLQCQFRAP